MFKLFENAPWHQVYDFLADGNPPLVVRILVLNTMFFILFAYRRARGIPAMREATAIKVQGFLIAANALILFEPEIEATLNYIHRLI